MKTIKTGKKIERVSDDEAFARVTAGKAAYIAKHVWKKEVRDATSQKK